MSERRSVLHRRDRRDHGAIGVIACATPSTAVLALVCHLISLAALFLLLRAEFVAAAQVVVYAGAVMVLYVFVVAYVGGEPRSRSAGTRPALRRSAPSPVRGALAIELFIAMLGSGLQGSTGTGAPYVAGFGTPAAIGKLLLTRLPAPVRDRFATCCWSRRSARSCSRAAAAASTPTRASRLRPADDHRHDADLLRPRDRWAPARWPRRAERVEVGRQQ
jgi:NADH:ubiquinone oxidoreductase subunit 6 (subunit J)